MVIGLLTVTTRLSHRSRGRHRRRWVVVKNKQVHLFGPLHRFLGLRRTLRRGCRLVGGTACRSRDRAWRLLFKVVRAFVLIVLRRTGSNPVAETSRAGPVVCTFQLGGLGQHCHGRTVPSVIIPTTTAATTANALTPKPAITTPARRDKAHSAIVSLALILRPICLGLPTLLADLLHVTE